MILSDESDDEHHDDDEDVADQIFFLEEALSSTGNSVSNVFQELSLVSAESFLGSNATETSILDDVYLLNGDDLDDCPDDSNEAAYGDGDHLCGIAHDAVA